MSREFLLKTAQVLEKLAEHLDQEEQQRQKTAQAEQLRAVQTLGERIANTTGETLPDELLEKIATSDQSIIEAFTKLAKQHNEMPPENLGEASDIRDNNTTTSTTQTERIKEASAQADNRFMNWIMS